VVPFGERLFGLTGQARAGGRPHEPEDIEPEDAEDEDIEPEDTEPEDAESEQCVS
jgi:hypothetical protein